MGGRMCLGCLELESARADVLMRRTHRLEPPATKYHEPRMISRKSLAVGMA